jgi:S-adenosyl-L-methionine hydrolase (adenosine-forming)
MPVITLTTDLGLKDYYVASVKAAILSRCPEAVIIDISHLVPKFDILQTAFILGNVYADFPAGTIHLIGVMAEKPHERPFVAVAFKGQYFIGADDGTIPMITIGKPDLIIEFHAREKTHAAFPLKDILAEAACHILMGGKPEEMGKIKNQLFQKTGFHAIVTENTIRGSVVYIDDFGNVFVNITERLFLDAGKKRKFLISFRAGGYTIKAISKNYGSVPPGEMLAMFSATGFMEIAINTGNASELLGIKLNDIVLVDFY